MPSQKAAPSRYLGMPVLLGTIGIAVGAALDGRLPIIVFGPAAPAGASPKIVCWLVAGAAIATLARPRDRVAPLVVGSGWMLAALATAIVAIRDTLSLTAFVGPFECVVIGLAALQTGRWPLRAALAGCAAVMLVVFGLIHLTRPAEIASLIPSWIPATRVVPVATGVLQVIAGAATVWKRTRPVAAAAAAALFASWLPLVHAARIAARPGDVFEWQFAFMAMTLAGSLAVLAAHSQTGRAFDTAGHVDATAEEKWLT